ncbi:NAD(P)-dependent malic enzyme [Corynebacterium pygosceleis]|uniref:NADP-dependent malic enzyme n=1 Tax=Corynebacterium pygosceleis TaxID=2800406 RepID=A0A9Q4GLC1_9CORY|nr:NADP-dependent malic enzyme [Corynebacterium pygosceleis]MCK7637441.1 NADP-dependent malic enzyme [Corynebacterium pygosceleis]MCL0119783.1 NADP-dependent malic enzyme [Corynebacterium pygosceleis]MCX7468230.1 NADP-dependent malic enzyme [Corynebacterium pygosceleis]
MNDHHPATLTDAEIFAAHEGGKIGTVSRRPVDSVRDLSIAYTPGVARVCEAIREDPALAHDYTWAGRNVAVVSDGSAVLGLGDIGPRAALPVMEGKAQLFGRFAGLNAVPVVLDTRDVDELFASIVAIAPSFGAINLEDISAPRCFELERRLIEALDIPVMHDDQHGTAIVITAALRNACTLLDRRLRDLRVVVSGAGAAGVACAKMLIHAGVRDVVMLDSRGIIHPERTPLNSVKRELARITNPRHVSGGVREALTGADTFIGLSRGHVGEEALRLMAPDPILFSLANPDPEITPDLAYRYGAVVATGRSDLPNQINNVLAFPGIFQGALAARATAITPAMKLAASRAIADIAAQGLDAEYIVPSPLDARVCPAVSTAVRAAALAEG